MFAVAFDTLKFAQNLRDKANFSPAQAEGVSQAFSEAVTDQLATRGDLADLATRGDIVDVRKEMGALRLQSKEDFARLEVKIESTRSENPEMDVRTNTIDPRRGPRDWPFLALSRHDERRSAR
jgi:hypothetical protein